MPSLMKMLSWLYCFIVTGLLLYTIFFLIPKKIDPVNHCAKIGGVFINNLCFKLVK